MITKTFIENMPKMELHVHLEGSIPLQALWTLIKKYDGDRYVRTIGELVKKFQYIDFPHFIDTWVWKNQFLREYEDFEYIAGNVARDFIRQNIHYAEMYFSPGDFIGNGLEPQEIARAIRKGLNQCGNEIKINLVADLIRDFGPARGMVWLEQINEVKDQGIIGITIGGSEHEFPPEPYQAVYNRARDLGFKTSAHAGEAAGPASIWSAIKDLKVDRIGHGTRAVEDSELVEYIIEKNIPVEMCPVSNVRTGVVGQLKEHPIKKFFEQGMIVSVNTDDPKMFNTSLADEFRLLIEVFGFNKDDIKRLVNNSIASAWCDNKQKYSLQTLIQHYFETIPSDAA